MTKDELIDKMAKDAGISKTAAATALESIQRSIRASLKEKNGKVILVGFGTFSKVPRKARVGRNPQTGKTIKIKAKNAIKFRAGSKLKNAVGGGTGDTGPRRK